MLPSYRDHPDVFEAFSFQLRPWLWAESLRFMFNSLSTSITQTWRDQRSADRGHHLQHSSRVKGLTNAKDRGWGELERVGEHMGKVQFSFIMTTAC